MFVHLPPHPVRLSVCQSASLSLCLSFHLDLLVSLSLFLSLLVHLSIRFLVSFSLFICLPVCWSLSHFHCDKRNTRHILSAWCQAVPQINFSTDDIAIHLQGLHPGPKPPSRHCRSHATLPPSSGCHLRPTGALHSLVTWLSGVKMAAVAGCTADAQTLMSRSWLQPLSPRTRSTSSASTPRTSMDAASPWSRSTLSCPREYSVSTGLRFFCGWVWRSWFWIVVVFFSGVGGGGGDLGESSELPSVDTTSRLPLPSAPSRWKSFNKTSSGYTKCQVLHWSCICPCRVFTFLVSFSLCRDLDSRYLLDWLLVTLSMHIMAGCFGS